jgi:hypothetical protein
MESKSKQNEEKQEHLANEWEAQWKQHLQETRLNLQKMVNEVKLNARSEMTTMK